MHMVYLGRDPRNTVREQEEKTANKGCVLEQVGTQNKGRACISECSLEAVRPRGRGQALIRPTTVTLLRFQHGDSLASGWGSALSYTVSVWGPVMEPACDENPENVTAVVGW